ncbi:MAG: DUF58 domain-containing protein [Acidimicrobiales bacterium]
MAAVLLAALGIVTGYREFVVLAIVAALVLAVAVLVPRVTSPIEFRRIDTPKFVPRGAMLTIRLEAESDRPAPPTRVIDQLSGAAVPIDMPEIDPTLTTVVTYRLQALRRGVHLVGPLLEERTDPFGLAVRTVEHDVVDEILVHPTIHPLRLPESGNRQRQTRATVMRFSEDPLADFRSLREYVVGDDSRLVHWASTAKTGTLMVRDHFELRRTTRCVILDTVDRAMTDLLFEDAVEIAASLTCESLERNIPVVAKTRDPHAPGRARHLKERQEALELFTRVQRTTLDDTLSVGQLKLTTDPGDQIFVVAGAASPLIAQMAGTPAFTQRVHVIRLHDRSVPLTQLTVRHTDVVSAEQFARRWNGGQVSLG